jgi:N-methylhydantoinase A
MADVVKDYSLTVMMPGDSPILEIERLFTSLNQQGQKEIAAEGIPKKNIIVEPLLDVRYFGQSYELTIPFSPDYLDEFHQTHNELYGYANKSGEVEIVNLRVKAVGLVEKPALPRISDSPVEDSSPAILHEKKVLFFSGQHKTRFYTGDRLKFGNVINGPAIILRPDTTILIGISDTAQVDRFANLIIKIGE